MEIVDGSLPTFIGVGVMKSGTTWISECLRQHPDVYVSDNKELHFFSNNFSKGLEWYSGNFSDGKQFKVRGEYSITYMDSSTTPQRILTTLGVDTKIIICLRDPIERLVSHLKHILRNSGNGKYPTLNLGNIVLEEFNRVTTDYPTLLNRGLYEEMVNEYISVFGEQNVLILHHSDIESKPEFVVKRLFGFLNVDDEFVPSVLNKTVSKGIVPRHLLIESLRRKIYLWSKKNSPKLIHLLRTIRVTSLLRKVNAKEINIKLDGQVVDFLEDYYSYYPTFVRSLKQRGLL